jgi:hypothetical protein
MSLNSSNVSARLPEFRKAGIIKNYKGILMKVYFAGGHSEKRLVEFNCRRLVSYVEKGHFIEAILPLLKKKKRKK